MNILDGKLVADIIENETRQEISHWKEKIGLVPGLTVVLVGDNPASQVYVRSKDRMAASLGLHSNVVRLDKNIPREKLIAEIELLNRSDDVDAVLVQLPLPPQFDTWDILDHLDPAKDVDRFHPVNQGMILLNRTRIFPCTPFGIVKILDYYKIKVPGMNAVVVGRSFIVGKPIANMLTNMDATVTVCHSKSKNLPDLLKQADLIVAAIGKPAFITADMVKEGAILIDVGINYISNKDEALRFCEEDQVKKFDKKGYAITGDIHKDAFKKASYYTPVPGGVGLMTVSMLMYNTLQLFKERRKLQ